MVGSVQGVGWRCVRGVRGRIESTAHLGEALALIEEVQQLGDDLRMVTCLSAAMCAPVLNIQLVLQLVLPGIVLTQPEHATRRQAWSGHRL